MRRSGLALAFVMFAVPSAFAEDAPPPAEPHAKPTPKPAEPPEVPDKPQDMKRCDPPKELKNDVQPVWESACLFFTGVAQRDPRRIIERLHTPFYFEAKAVNGIEDTERRWAQLLNDAGHAPSTLYSVDVYTYDEMVKKYGKPPAKLEGVPLRGAMIAVGNVDGRAQVAALKREGGSWMVFAFHD